MQKFTEVIKVEVEVESIHQQLLSTFPEDYKHKEILAHAIIGSSLSANKLGFIYNALNGYSSEIDFNVGDEIICSAEEKGFGRTKEQKKLLIGKKILLKLAYVK